MGKKTNSLRSHNGESRSHRVDKMSGLLKQQKEALKGIIIWGSMLFVNS